MIPVWLAEQLIALSSFCLVPLTTSLVKPFQTVTIQKTEDYHRFLARILSRVEFADLVSLWTVSRTA